MTVAVLVSSLKEGSETFVKHHIELLGPDTKVFHGGLTPFLDASESTKTEPSYKDKIIFRILQLLGKEHNIRNYLLKKLIRKNNITCCYAEFGPVGVGALEACRETNTKLVVNFHGYDAFRKDILDQYSVQYGELFDFCEHVIAVSSSMIVQLESLGCKREKLTYLPCYPNPLFCELEYAPTEKIVTFVGRFVEKKGPWLTLLAFNRVLQKHPDAKLVMAGDGPLLSVCKSICSALKINNVLFTGALCHDEVISLYRISMVYVQHSIVASSGDREGTPVSVMEAMYAGIPIVCTGHEGIRDIVEEGLNGILVDEQDIAGMADGVCRLLESEKLREKFSNSAKAAIHSFTIENSAASTLKRLTS